MRPGRARSIAAALCAASVLWAVPSPAVAQCGNQGPFNAFNEASAMRAIFCAYDLDQAGTLLPVQYTSPWNPQRAETLATPLLVTTYRERAVEKGLLVVQRQRMYEGEPSTGHAEGAVVSVYVFRRSNDTWTLETRADEALEAGAYGVAPGAELFTIGPDRFGLWFEGGNMGQGYSSTYAHVLTLSDVPIAEVGRFDIGASNSGTCSDDEKERNDTIHECWGWEAMPEFIAVEGRPHHLLRLRFSGTHAPEVDAPDRVTPKTGTVCYVLTGGKYVDNPDAGCGGLQSLDPAAVFVSRGVRPAQ